MAQQSHNPGGSDSAAVGSDSLRGGGGPFRGGRPESGGLLLASDPPPGFAPDAGDAEAGEVLARYLQAQAADLLRSLRLHSENIGGAEHAEQAAAAVARLRRAARRIGGALHTYRPLTDAAWADQLRAELGWLSATLASEFAYAARLDRLLTALHRLSAGPSAPAPAPLPGRGAPGDAAGAGDGAAGNAGGSAGDGAGGGREGAAGGAAGNGAGGGREGAAGGGALSAVPAPSGGGLAGDSVRGSRARAREAGGAIPERGQSRAVTRVTGRGVDGGGAGAGTGVVGARARVPGGALGGGSASGAGRATGQRAGGQDSAGGAAGSVGAHTEAEARGGAADAEGGGIKADTKADAKPDAGADAKPDAKPDAGADAKGGTKADRGAAKGEAAGKRAGGRSMQRGSSSTDIRAGVAGARTGALLERQLTLSRTRAHSAALQALGSARFHAVADAVAVLASEVPLNRRSAQAPAAQALPALVELAHHRLEEAVGSLPLVAAGHAYNADASVRTLAAEPDQDAAWHQVRLLVRLRRYAQEVLQEGSTRTDADAGPGERTALGGLAGLTALSHALDDHRDAVAAASAAAAAARTPRITPATAYALGVLHADQRHEAEAARFTFSRLWQQLASERRPR